MRTKLSLILVVLLVLPLLQVQASTPVPAVDSHSISPSQSTDTDETPTDRIIIRYKTSADLSANAAASADRMSALSAAAGVQLAYFREMSGDAHVLSLPGKLPLAQVRTIAARLMTLSDVEYAEPDYILQPTLTPDDTYYGEQWHYFETYGINAPAAWDITTGSTSIVVAVIDTGITDHSDLAGRTVPGYDFIADVNVANDGDGRDSDPHDPGDWITSAESSSGYFVGCKVTNSSWHGTHVAGTIGALSNNGLGVTGINWVSKILPVRVLGKCGGYTSDIVDGMRWAAGLSVSGVTDNANPAKVENMSLGGSGSCSTTQQNAINEITAAGTTVVVAAGNSNLDASGFQPANCNGVITVAATDRNGNRAYYSNYGSMVEIAAPGGDTRYAGSGVLSTLNTGTQGPVADTYAFYQGTSMATPHVAGVASLLYSLAPSLTPAQVLQILQTTVTAFPGGTCNTWICGAGIVNAGAAVGALPRITTLSPASVPVGNGAFTLAVNGANFVSGATVYWNGSPRTTTFVNSGQLNAAITAADVAAGDTFSITVGENHPTYGSITTVSKPFTMLASDVSISKAVLGSDLKPGDGVTFTLSIANQGGMVAAGIVVTDSVPSQVLSPTFASNIPITRTGVLTYVWNVGTLGVGQSGVITIYGQIDPALPTPLSFVNTAYIGSPMDHSPSNNTSSAAVGGSQVFLPIVMKRWPPIPDTPVLNAVSSSGGGNYTVSWNVAYLADTYTLQEDDNVGFSSLTTVYGPGASLSWNASSKPVGTYYYRVKATNSYGDSGWSNVQSITVQNGPTPGFWQDSGTGGTEFYVTSDGASVNQFAVYVTLEGCGDYKITENALVSISNNQFSFSGSFYATGTFNSSTAASGQNGLSSFGPVCGYYWNGGPWSWAAIWKNSSQPSSADLLVAYPVAAATDDAPSTLDETYSLTPIK